MTGEVGFGQRLKVAREARRLSREDVADVLKLPPRIIQLLEQQQMDQLPVAAFTVGYLRAYAKLLELNGDELVVAYRALNPEAEESNPVTGEVASIDTGNLPRSSAPWSERIQADPGVVIGGAVVVAALLIGLILWIVWPEESAKTPVAGLVDAVPPSLPVDHIADSAPDSALDAEPDADSSGSPAKKSVTLGTASTATEAGVQGGPHVAEPEVTQAEPQVEVGAQPPPPGVTEGNSSLRRISPVGEDRLVFSFREDCWVEVKDSTGRNLYSDLNRANTTLNLVGQAPFRVILGYAPGVELSFNGTPVALSAHTRNNVASVMLGQ